MPTCKHGSVTRQNWRSNNLREYAATLGLRYGCYPEIRRGFSVFIGLLACTKSHSNFQFLPRSVDEVFLGD
jgi:hypothetical protein